MKFELKSFNELTSHEVYEILKSRAEIFTVEKGMRVLDPDGRDFACLHGLLTDDGRLIAYLRVEIKEGELKVGRVLTLTHGQGHGRLLMEHALPVIAKAYGRNDITVHAQIESEGFYRAIGFTAVSDVYIEAGVPHVTMRLVLE